MTTPYLGACHWRIQRSGVQRRLRDKRRRDQLEPIFRDKEERELIIKEGVLRNTSKHE